MSISSVSGSAASTATYQARPAADNDGDEATESTASKVREAAAPSASADPNKGQKVNIFA